MTGPAVVSSLHRYPVKSCAPERLDRAEVSEAGLAHDRGLAVVVGDQIVTQREFPGLARVRPVLDDATGLLSLSHDDLAPVSSRVDTSGPTREVTIFDEPVLVVDQAEALSAWFGEVLGRPARLVGAPGTTRRTSPGEVPGRTVLSDEGTVSLHSLASLARLNEELAARDHPPLPADRFRANVVIDGCAAHAEDAVSGIEIGDVRLAFAQVDVRCAVTTVDQQAGRRAGPEPLRSLAEYRRTDAGGVAFGVYLAVLSPGTVRVGDPVTLVPRS